MSDYNLMDFMVKALSDEFNKKVEQHVQESLEKFETVLRSEVGRIAVSILSTYELERQGDLLIIKVKDNREVQHKKP